MNINCPKCGSDRNSTFIDEAAMLRKCLDCGELIEETTDIEKVEAAKPTPKHFNGEMMECCMCGRNQQHQIGMKSQWTLVGEEPYLLYVCPGCLQESEQAKRGHWSTVYQKVMRRYARLRERHMRGLNN